MRCYVTYIEDDNILVVVHGWHLLLPELQGSVVASPHLCQVLCHGRVCGGGWEGQVSSSMAQHSEEEEDLHYKLARIPVAGADWWQAIIFLTLFPHLHGKLLWLPGIGRNILYYILISC